MRLQYPIALTECPHAHIRSASTGIALSFLGFRKFKNELKLRQQMSSFNYESFVYVIGLYAFDYHVEI